MALKRKTRKPMRKNRVTKKEVRKIAAKVVLSKSESNYTDTVYDASPSYLGLITNLSTIAQGTTDQTRIGDSVLVTSLNLGGYITNQDSYNMVRIIIFKWKGNSSSPPNVTDIIQQAYVGDVKAPFAPLAHDTRKNFTVKWDKTFLCATGADNERQFFKKLVTFKGGLKLQYLQGSSSATSKNGLYMLRISDSSAISHPTCNVLCRVNFKDI